MGTISATLEAGLKMKSKLMACRLAAVLELSLHLTIFIERSNPAVLLCSGVSKLMQLNMSDSLSRYQKRAGTKAGYHVCHYNSIGFRLS